VLFLRPSVSGYKVRGSTGFYRDPVLQLTAFLYPAEISAVHF